jgi:hypothetical protein
MSPTLCPNCGARFAEVHPGTNVRCAFCHTSTYIPKYAQRSGADEPVRRTSSSGLLVAVAMAMGVLAMGAAGAAFFLFSAAPRPAGPPPSDPYQDAMALQAKAMADVERIQKQAMQQAEEAIAKANGLGADGKPSLTLATLATTPFDGRMPLEAPGMVGTLEAFDLVANIEWARSISRAWTEDAELHRLEVQRVSADGTVNLRTVPEASVMYRFLSPKRVKEYLESASLTVPKVNYELFVFVDAKGVWVQKISGDASSERDTKTFQSLPACTLARAFAALEAAHKLPARPVYNADFYVYDTNASWKLDTITGQPRIPSVRGKACTVE